jgi:hypothetical protein
MRFSVALLAKVTRDVWLKTYQFSGDENLKEKTGNCQLNYYKSSTIKGFQEYI